MRTDVEIDDVIMAEAMKVAGKATEQEAIQEAVLRMVTISRQRQALQELRGIGWYGDEEEVRGNRYTVEA